MPQLKLQTAPGVYTPITVIGGSGGASDGEPALGNPLVDGYVLSSTTAGVRSWVAQSGGSSFDTNLYVTLSADRAVTTGADRKILFDTVSYDGNSEWDAVNLYWKSKANGYYMVSIGAAAVSTYTATFRTLIYVDGAIVRYATVTAINNYATPAIVSIPNLYVASGSYIEAYCRISSNTSVENSTNSTWFHIARYK